MEYFVIYPNVLFLNGTLSVFQMFVMENWSLSVFIHGDNQSEWSQTT